MANNLIQKPGESTWYVKLAIPADVQSAFGGRKVMIRSLKTALRSEAMDRRLAHLSTWKKMIQAARAAKALPENWAEHVSFAASSMNTATLLKKRQLIGEKVAIPSPDYDEQLVTEALEKAGLTEAIAELRNYFGNSMDGQLQFQENLAAIFKELIPTAYSSQFTLSANELDNIRALVSSPESYKPRSPYTDKKLDAFRRWYETFGKRARTVDTLIRKVEMFSAWINKTGCSISFDSVTSYVDGLQDSKGQPLSSQTKKMYLWANSTFWKWAKKHDSELRETFKELQNPFEGHDLPRVKNERVSYDAFTKEEVETLHRAALTKKDQNLANLIAIAAYTGCRLEEIGHIHQRDCKIEEGEIISFNIPDAKSQAGIRDVPVHSDISTLMAELLKSSSDGFLLTGRALDESNIYGHRLDAVGKRFGRLKTANGFGSTHVLHSIRKTAITLVHQAGGTMEVMAGLFGHETGLITLDIYSTGPSLNQKRQVIDLLSYDFNLKQTT